MERQKKTGKNRSKQNKHKKHLLTLILSGIFLFGILGSRMQAKAATDAEALNSIIPIIFGCDENGEPVSAALGLPIYTEELGVVIVSSERYMGGCYAYVMIFYTADGSTMEIITPFLASEEYQTVFFYPQSDSAFTASFETGSMADVTTDTELINVLLSDAGELYVELNYCLGAEGNFYKLAYSLTDIMGGSLVLNSEDAAVVGMVVDKGDMTYFVDMETVIEIYRSAIADSTGGQGGGGGSTGGGQGSGGSGSSGQGSGGSSSGGQGSGGSSSGGQGSGGSSTGGQGSGGSSSSGQGIGGGFWGIVVVVIVVALAILLYTYSKKRKTGGKQKEYESENVSSECSIMGISGVHAGAVFPLDELMVLGRDTGRCNLIFAGDTQGISGVHCQISPVGYGAELMDLGSSYGTFLQDGTRLTPHTPYTLNRGDVFYLADRQYSYRVQ